MISFVSLKNPIVVACQIIGVLSGIGKSMEGEYQIHITIDILLKF